MEKQIGQWVVALCLLASCNLRKESTYERTAFDRYRETVTNEGKQVQNHGKVTTASIRLASANSVTEITPMGTFRLSADSGYIGQAERVLISQESRDRQHVASTWVTSTESRSATTAATREHTAFRRDTLIRHQEIGVSQPWKVPWWVWLCVPCAVLYLVWRWRMR